MSDTDRYLLLTRSPGAPPHTLREYREQGGYEALEQALGKLEPHEVIEAIEAAKLRGRGGASFPTARKWRIAAAAEADPKYVIANGGEHEPGSDKDKHLVEFYPHAVLEGLLLCAYATGASKGYLYLIEDMLGPIRSAERAIQELRDCGLIGERILGSDFSFDLLIHQAPATYVAGEETAAIDSIEGGPGKPRSKPPYPGEDGLFGRPTTVNNVETLAHVPVILRRGAAWYAGVGSGESTGSMLFTLGSEVERPGVYELPFGSTYRELIFDSGGGPIDGREIRAILPAMSCAFLAAEHLDTQISHESLAAHGSSPGCGGVQLVLEGDDVVARVAKIARFFMDVQCGQCPPCEMATSQLVHLLKAIMEGAKGDFLGHVAKVAEFTKGRGRCSLIPMAIAPVRSAMELFREDFEGYGT